MYSSNINTITYSRQGHFLGIAILIAFLLPHTNTLFLLVNPLLCLLLACTKKKRNGNSLVWLVVIPIVISVMLNIQAVSSKALLSTATIFLYFICFPFVGRIKINNFYIYFCFGYILISQLAYLLGIPFLINFFDTTYPINEADMKQLNNMRETITFNNMLTYRFGGIYHNSNDCARTLTMLLAFYLVMNQGKSNRGVILFSYAVFAAILLTGSRTGFVISVLTLFFGLFKKSTFSRFEKFVFIAIAILGIGYIIGTGSSFRGLKVESGLHDSANFKWNTFIYYITNESNPISLLFGHIDASLFEGQYGVAMNSFDCEYGTLIYRFGFVGFICILLFYYWGIIKCIDKSKRFYFIILLWMISSTILASFRACFIFMLLTSVVYSNNSVLKKQ